MLAQSWAVEFRCWGTPNNISPKLLACQHLSVEFTIELGCVQSSNTRLTRN